MLSGEGLASTDVLAQDMLHMNEYFTNSQTRYVQGTGQVLSCTATLQPHALMGLMMMVVVVAVVMVMIELRLK